MHDLFKKDISNFSIAELRDFIKNCRQAIQPNDAKYADSPSAYETEVLTLSSKWIEYIDSISDKLHEKERALFWERYRQAIVGCGIRDELYAIRFESEDRKKYKDKVVFVDKDYFEKELYFSKVTNPDDTEESIKRRYQEIRQILIEATSQTYKEDVENIIIDAQITQINIYTAEVKGNPADRAKVFEIDGKLYESEKKYYFDDTNDGKPRGYIQSRFSIDEYQRDEYFYKSDVEKELRKYHVTPTIYNNYRMSRTENIKKKFYINVCFYLSLDDVLANLLLMKHGYSFISSCDRKDDLYRKYFKYGLSFEQAVVMLKRKKISITRQKTIGIEQQKATLENVFTNLYSDTVDAASYLPTIRKVVSSIESHIASKLKDMEGIKKEISALDDKLSKSTDNAEKKEIREMRRKAKMRYNTQKKREYQPQSYLGRRCEGVPENQNLEDLEDLVEKFRDWERQLLNK